MYCCRNGLTGPIPLTRCCLGAATPFPALISRFHFEKRLHDHKARQGEGTAYVRHVYFARARIFLRCSGEIRTGRGGVSRSWGGGEKVSGVKRERKNTNLALEAAHALLCPLGTHTEAGKKSGYVRSRVFGGFEDHGDGAVEGAEKVRREKGV